MQGNRTQISVVSLKYCIIPPGLYPLILLCPDVCWHLSKSLYKSGSKKLGYQGVCVPWMNFQVCNETHIHQHFKLKEEASHQPCMWLLSASAKEIPPLWAPVSQRSTTASAEAKASACSPTWISSSTNLSLAAPELRDSCSQEQSNCSTEVPLNR